MIERKCEDKKGKKINKRKMKKGEKTKKELDAGNK